MSIIKLTKEQMKQSASITAGRKVDKRRKIDYDNIKTLEVNEMYVAKKTASMALFTWTRRYAIASGKQFKIMSGKDKVCIVRWK